MSDWNQLETMLRSWTPRPPSAELKDKLFTASGPAASPARAAMPERKSHAPAWGWLAPAAACGLTFTVLFGADSFHGSNAGAPSRALFAMTSLTSSNRGANLPAKWFGLTASDLNLEWNVWSKTTFDWTNQGQFLSTNDSMQLARTNYLMQ